jgi:hypothetical protein
MKLSKSFLVAFILTTVLAPLSLNAAITPYTSKAAYDAAVASAGLVNIVTEDFQSTTGPLGSGIGPHSFTQNSVTYSGSGIRFSAGSNPVNSGNNSLGTIFSGGWEDITDDLTIAIPPSSRAVGFNFLTSYAAMDPANFFRASAGGVDVEFTNFLSGTAVASGSDLPVIPYRSFFIGFVGDTIGDTIGSATLSAFNSASVDGFRIDNVQVAAVPEPSSMLLAGVAGLLGLVRRRAKRVD